MLQYWCTNSSRWYLVQNGATFLLSFVHWCILVHCCSLLIVTLEHQYNCCNCCNCCKSKAKVDLHGCRPHHDLLLQTLSDSPIGTMARMMTRTRTTIFFSPLPCCQYLWHCHRKTGVRVGKRWESSQFDPKECWFLLNPRYKAGDLRHWAYSDKGGGSKEYSIILDRNHKKARLLIQCKL